MVDVKTFDALLAQADSTTKEHTVYKHKEQTKAGDRKT